MTREIAVIAFAQTRHSAEDEGLAEIEMLAPIITEVKQKTGLKQFGFTCSGSCDYLAGAPFSFVSALDAVGAWPPISESHVEMDAAWALYEAWVRLLHGDIDTALVYGFGKSSQGDLRTILTQQLDPYHLAPLGIDAVSLAALQARAYLERSGTTEDDLRAVAARSRQAGRDNPFALHLPEPEGDEYDVAPLRPYDVAPITDGAAAIVLASGDKARELCERPAWITGIDHRTEPHSPGVRDLTRSESARIAGEKAGAAGVEVAELHAQFSHEELILKEALGLDGGEVAVNPSGGALSANPMMAAGLIRIGEAASRIHDGTATRTLGHASSGPCLQQNLVCVLSGEDHG
ncbi:thiolase domain-containing protein [Actinomadura syzygii]|uniref:Lipid-transfer protein n=1 Tax=Actinomadura syzygii TaxID=1427538 RepID=A0A5D0TWY3_9ACTN|nr:thiolase domain-containing protein [Actinomadura syzygii]TYC09950.1 lipid-transfer protein [Actinomadura syzygii]